MQFLPFKQTVHDIRARLNLTMFPRSPVHHLSMQTTGKLQCSFNRAIAGFVWYNHSTSAAYRAVNEAQNRLLMQYYQIFSSEYKLNRFTHVKLNADVCFC